MTEGAGEPALAVYARALADDIEAVLATWVVDRVQRIFMAWQGSWPADVAAGAEDAGARAVAEIVPAVRALLAADIDDQRTTPLAILRLAVRYPTGVLEAAGVPPLERDDFSVSAFPDDIYDLTPASYADLDPALAEPAIHWGAAKAFEHKRRHQPGR